MYSLILKLVSSNVHLLLSYLHFWSESELISTAITILKCQNNEMLVPKASEIDSEGQGTPIRVI